MTPITTAKPPMSATNRRHICHLPPTGPRRSHSLLDEMPVHEFLGELHTLEIYELSILLHATVKGHAHLPGACKHLRVVDGRFVRQMIGAGRSIALDNA